MRKLAVIIVLLIIAYWQRSWIKQKFTEVKNKLLPGSGNTGTSSGRQKKLPGNGFESFKKWPLHRGNKGIVVTVLQQKLNQKYNAGLKVDGLFGKKTEAALVKNGFPKSLSMLDYAKIIGTSVIKQ